MFLGNFQECYMLLMLDSCLTLLSRGEENIYLDDFDVKLRKKLLCKLFFFLNIYSCRNEKRIFFNFMFNVKK
jgi:hypothetical protein